MCMPAMCSTHLQYIIPSLSLMSHLQLYHMHGNFDSILIIQINLLNFDNKNLMDWFGKSHNISNIN